VPRAVLIPPSRRNGGKTTPFRRHSINAVSVPQRHHDGVAQQAGLSRFINARTHVASSWSLFSFRHTGLVYPRRGAPLPGGLDRRSARLIRWSGSVAQLEAYPELEPEPITIQSKTGSRRPTNVLLPTIVLTHGYGGNQNGNAAGSQFFCTMRAYSPYIMTPGCGLSGGAIAFCGTERRTRRRD